VFPVRASKGELRRVLIKKREPTDGRGEKVRKRKNKEKQNVLSRKVCGTPSNTGRSTWKF